MAKEELEKAPERAAWQADPAAIAAIVAGRHGDPFAILGAHGTAPRTVRVFIPRVEKVAVLLADGAAIPLERTDIDGFFEGPVPGLEPGSAYRLLCRSESASFELEDPYRFPPVLGELDVHLLAEGNHLQLYEKMGAHPMLRDGVAGTGFAVWAPNATRASVIGPFNEWDGRRHPMRKRIECGVFELFLPHVGKGDTYKFELVGPTGELLPHKADPFAFAAEHPPATASVVHGLVEHDWQDAAWMARRAAAQSHDAPISIYELHLGSWRRVPEEGNRFLTYDELADQLIPYVKDLGFTHIELMPVSEFPFDGSWGYQPIGLFAPTSRFGPPTAFARLVDRCHQAGIGVIIDWVPGHFPTDEHGLGLFDGTALYEHADPRQGFHQDWNTLIYNFGRTEVANFLHANALFWLDRFHIDALRVDAVASMLYLDYSRKAGEWIPNAFGSNENLGAIAFLKRLNELTFGRFPGSTTMAEESTAWPAVSRPVYLGGLGFGFKWNMGWMHDTLAYIGREPVHRKFHQDNLTFGLLYAFSENFILPLSHDEVVHGKGSLLSRMPGDPWQQFANLRAYLGFMWAHPGKKLLFMGGELAQGQEWRHDQSLDWHLLDHPLQRGVHALVQGLNRLYRETPALHELDGAAQGFEWIDASDSQQSVLSFLRRGRDPEEVAIVVCNFTPVPRYGYRIGVPFPGRYAERLNTDARELGGSGVGNCGAVIAEAAPWHGRPSSLLLTLPPLATLVFTLERC